MKPFYQDAWVTLYHADCRDVLPTLAAGSVDLVLTDPPYGIGKADWDGAFPLWWTGQAQRISPCLGLMPGVWNILKCPAVLGALRYRWTLSAHITNGMTRGAIGFGNWIPCLVYTATDAASWCLQFATWCKDNGIKRRELDDVAGTSDMGGWWTSTLGYRAAIPTPEQWTKIKTAFSPPDSLDLFVFAQAYQCDGDARRFSLGDEKKVDHPSPKPLSVVAWFIGRLPGRSVLDPFAGSGTTLRAAKDLGRKAIGIEIEERYCEIAARRMEQGVLEFPPPPERVEPAELFTEGE